MKISRSCVYVLLAGSTGAAIGIGACAPDSTTKIGVSSGDSGVRSDSGIGAASGDSGVTDGSSADATTDAKDASGD